MEIVADVPEPVLGWGLDLMITDPTVVSVVGLPAIGPLWSATNAPDGDGLAALAFPNGITGSSVLLATITLSADAPGETDLVLSFTPDDLTEGFALDPAGFAAVMFESARLTVLPEPVSLCLLALASLGLVCRSGERSQRR